ncbi:Ankyrin repeat and SOCS box protein 14 [Gnomoniopsis sp. IMI 355080]|nr:Ankyrin repeat and SOCS box protein 14 [Gnomoniopsis sp. IMI 355080]
MDTIPQTSTSSAEVLRIADIAYRNVNRLNEILRYWSSAPSEVCRLRDATAKLHDLLNSFWRAQREDDNTSANSKNVTETLGSDIKFATSALSHLTRSLDFVCNPDVLNELRQSKSTIRIKSRWSMRREMMSVLQGQLDESSHRLLARLMESKVTTITDYDAGLEFEQKYLPWDHFTDASTKFQDSMGISTKSMPGISRNYDPPTTSQDVIFAGSEVRNYVNERKFQYLEHVTSAITTYDSVLQHGNAKTWAEPWPHELDWNRDGMTSACRCQCHTTRGFQQHSRWGLMAFKSTLGLFSLYFRGTSKGGNDRSACTVADCEYTCSKPGTTIKVVYTFPTWLFHAAITAVFSNQNGSPEMLLRVVRRIHNSDVDQWSIIRDIRVGNVQSVRRALQTRRITIFDVMGRDGMSLLNVAVLDLQLEAFKLLIQAGADIFHEDDNGRAPCRDILTHIYARSDVPLNYRQELEASVPMDQIIEAAELSDLHRAVMGINYLQLDEFLPTVDDVNAVDVFGRTALWYASSVGDAASVRALLAAGALPDLGPDQGPLHIAARYGHHEVVCLLLDAGAEVDPGPKWLSKPLVLAATGGSYKIVAELIRHGANVNACDKQGSVALHLAAGRNYVDIIELLLEAGAEINCRDLSEDVPLMEALCYNSVEAALLLLRLGADYNIPNDAKWGVLHHLGGFSSLETIRIFTEKAHLIAGLDTRAQDVHGKTAMQVCIERASRNRDAGTVDSELMGAFANLLKAVEAVDHRPGSDCEEEFFDAEQ